MVHITSRPSEDFRSYRFSGFPYRLSRALPVARSCFLLRHCALNNFIGHWNLNQLSFAYASCYGLGPGLPWDDERCPGSLRLSVGRILTVLFATYTGILTSARSTSPSGLTSLRAERSPTHCPRQCRGFGSMLEPRIFSAQGLSTSELLRTLLMSGCL